MAAKGSSLRDILKQAEAAQKAGDASRALALFARVLADAPNHSKARQAVLKLRRAEGGGATLTQADVDRVLALLGSGAAAEAVARTRVLLTLAPRQALLHNILGMALAAEDRPQEAMRAFQAALRIQPDYAEALANLGSAQVQTEDYTRARATLEKALARNPRIAEAENNLAIVEKAAGHRESALAHAAKALALRPDYANAFNTKGSVLVELKRWPEAIAAFRSGLRHAPDDRDLRLNLGGALDASGALDEAIETYREAAQNPAVAGEAWHRLGDLHGRLGDRDAAIAAFGESIRADATGAPRAYRNLSVLHRFSAGDPLIGEMEALFDAPDATDEARMHLGFALGKALEDCGEPDAAFGYLKIGNREKRKRVSAYSTAGERRLIERIKAVFTAEFAARAAPVASHSEKPILIVGMNRSGTTLVEQILASHSRVFGGDELEYVDLFGQRNAERLEAVSASELAAFAEGYLQELDAISGGAARVSDKMPANFHWLGLVMALFPNARIVNLQRDPRDNCLSIWRNFFASNGNQYAYDLVELGEYYVMYRDLMAHWNATFPGRIHTISYEDLVADQEGRTRALLDYCGLGWEDAVLDFHHTERQVRTASIGQVRQKIYRSSVRSWKRFEHQLAPLFEVLEAAGYLPADD